MAEAEMMRKILLTVSLALVCLGAGAQEFTWSRHVMDGSRTGVKASNADNVTEVMGRMKGRKYVAPNGRKFKKGVTPEVASLLLGAQPQMTELKQVVAYSTNEMIREYPECEIGNWFVDALMSEVEKISGRKVDFAVTNFGGIRVDMPKGDVLLDDIVSMFPFKNKVCYLDIKGKDIRVLLEHLAAKGWQNVGGARCVVRDKKLVSAEIGGEPLDDERIYGVATVDFLLNGGDDIFVARNAVDLKIYDQIVIDVILPYVRSLTAQGKPIEYAKDGRIQIID